jgi:AraC family transcriptional regulator
MVNTNPADQLGDQEPLWQGQAHWSSQGPLAPFVTRLNTWADSGVAMVQVLQPAGDVSDPPLPELTIGLLRWASQPTRFSFDFGAGRFERVARSGEMTCVSPLAGATIHAAGAHAAEALSIPAAVAARVLQSDGSRGSLDFGALHSQLFEDEFARCAVLQLSAWSDPVHGTDGLARDSLLTALLFRIRELAQQTQRAPAPRVSTLALWQIQRVQDYLQAHIGDNVALSDLAALVGLSPHHFCRVFSKTFGRSPIQYLIERRIERACELLDNGIQPVAEVAAQVGYDDPGYFARLFRQRMGVSPSRYSRNERLGDSGTLAGAGAGDGEPLRR